MTAHGDRQAVLFRFLWVIWAVAALIGSAVEPAHAREELRSAVGTLYQKTIGCEACHNGTPSAATAQGPLAQALGSVRRGDEVERVRTTVNATFASRFASGDLTVDAFNKSSGSAVISLDKEGKSAFRLSGAYAASVELSPADNRFVLRKSGADWTLSPSSQVALKNVFGSVNLALVSSNSEKIFYCGATPCVSNPGLRRLEVQLNLFNNPPVVDTSFFTIVADATAVASGRAVATDPDGDSLLIETVPGRGPRKGTVVFNTDGTFTYDPTDAIFDEPFSDSFDISITDRNKTTTGAVTIRGSRPNTAPIPADKLGGPYPADEELVFKNVIPPARDAEGDDITYFVDQGDTCSKGGTLTITDASTGNFEYVSATDFNASEICQYSVTDGLVKGPTGTLPFLVGAVADTAIASDYDVPTIDLPEFNTRGSSEVVNLVNLVNDKDTADSLIAYKILKIYDSDPAGSLAEIADSELASLGTFSPPIAKDAIIPRGGTLQFESNPNLALDFTIIYQAYDPDEPAVSPCADFDSLTDACGKIRFTVTLKGEKRHTEEQRKLLASQLGDIYRSLEDGKPEMPNFPVIEATGACNNCHVKGKERVSAPNCQSSDFFNGFGQRLCAIRPFQDDFAARIDDVLAATDGFEPSVTRAPLAAVASEIEPEGTPVGDTMSFTPGWDLLTGRDAKIIDAYIQEPEARPFFRVRLLNGGSEGQLVLGPKSLSLFTRETLAVTVLPVNDGGPDVPGTSTGKPGFYPKKTAGSTRTIQISIKREIPVARNDAAQVSTEAEFVDIPVLDNDTANPTKVRLEDLPAPKFGKIEALSNGKVRYFPNRGSTGTDEFKYKAIRTFASSELVSLEPATVTVTIYPADVPVAQDDVVFATLGEKAVFDVLANDQPKGVIPQTLTILTAMPTPFGNAVSVAKKIEYTATVTGTDIFEYEIANAAGVATKAKVTVKIGKVSGDILANATMSEALKPVARALGDTCRNLEQSGGDKTADQTDLVEICNDLADDASGGATLDQAMDQIRNEETLVAGDAAMQHDQQAAANILGRLDAIRGGKGRGMNFSQFNLQVDDTVISGALVDATLAKTSREDRFAKKGDLPWGVFVAGNVALATQDNSEREAGFDMTSVLLTGGIDYAVSDDMLLGLAISGGQSLTELGGGSELAMQSLQASLYGSFNIVDGLYVDGYGGIATNTFDMQRAINFAAGGVGVNRTAAGVFDGESISAALRLKYDHDFGEALFSTYGTLSYIAVFTDAYVEKGAGGLGLSVGEQNFDALTATVGARLSGEIQLDEMVIKPYVGASYARQLDSDQRSVRSSFTAGGVGGSSFLVTTESDGVNFGNFELGFALDYLDLATVNVDVTGTLSDGGFESYAVKAGLNIPLGVPPPPPEPPPAKPKTVAVDQPVVNPRNPTPNPGDVPLPDDNGTGGSGGGGSSGGGGWN